jgi:hypothetical protein
VSTLGLFVLNTLTGAVQRVYGSDPDETVGQPVFTPEGRGIVYTAWTALPVKLGMIYCYQRRCVLKLASFSPGAAEVEATGAAGAGGSTHVVITPHLRLARSPQFSPVANGSSPCLIFVGSRVGMDTHNASVELFSVDWATFFTADSPVAKALGSPSVSQDQLQAIHSFSETASRVLIDDSTVSSVRLAGYSFPGLYCGGVRARGFIGEDLLVLETQWRSCSTLLVTNVQSGSVHLLQYHNGGYHLSCDFNHDFEKTDASSPPLPFETDSRPEGSVCSSWLGPCLYSSSIVDALPGGHLILMTSSPSAAPVMAVVRTSDVCMAVKQTFQDRRRFVQLNTVISDPFPPMAINSTAATTPADTAPVPSSHCGVRSFIVYTACPPADSVDGLLSTDSRNVIESILLLPDQKHAAEQPPLIVSPHGGPHSAFTTTYMPHYADYLCRGAGMAVLLVNYRGSTVSELSSHRVHLQDKYPSVSCNSFEVLKC